MDNVKDLLNNIQKLFEQEEQDDRHKQYEKAKCDVDRFYGEHPKCFVKLKKTSPNTGTYILPICNRAGIEDPQAINFSMKIVKSLIATGTTEFDTNELNSTLDTLQHKNNSLSRVVGAQAQETEKLKRKLVSKIMGYFELKN